MLDNIGLINADGVGPEERYFVFKSQVEERRIEILSDQKRGAFNLDVLYFCAIAPDIGDGFICQECFERF